MKKCPALVLTTSKIFKDIQTDVHSLEFLRRAANETIQTSHDTRVELFWENAAIFPV